MAHWSWSKAALVNIIEFGSYATYFLQISVKDGGMPDVLWLLKIGDRVEADEIRAFKNTKYRAMYLAA